MVFVFIGNQAPTGNSPFDMLADTTLNVVDDAQIVPNTRRIIRNFLNVDFNKSEWFHSDGNILFSLIYTNKKKISYWSVRILYIFKNWNLYSWLTIIAIN